MKYLIIGNGFVGNYIYKNVPDSVLFIDKLKDCKSIKELFLKYPEHIIVNCAGKKGIPNVGWCEDNKEDTFDANVRLPMMLNEVAKELNRYWVHISTGCIYDGYEKMWDEEDVPNFYGSFYSRTKIWAENIINKECLILRIRMLTTIDGNPNNFLQKIINYSKSSEINNQNSNSLTYMDDFIKAFVHLTKNKHMGIFNIVNNGYTSIPEILNKFNIKYVISKNCNHNVTNKRSNCHLSISKLINTGFIMPDIRERLGIEYELHV